MQLYDGPPPSYEAMTDVPQIWRWGPGKSGPRLIQDLAGHKLGADNLVAFPSSLLSDTFEDEKHSWIIDLAHDQTFGDARTLRACCEITRVHVELEIDYEDVERADLSRHCQFNDNLHHFQLLADETVRQPGRYDAFSWACSRCPTTLVVKVRAPEIPRAQLDALYRIRPQSSFSRPNSKQDEAKPSRLSTLQGLEYLLRNTANSNPTDSVTEEPREIQYSPGSMFEKRVGHEKEIIDVMKCLMFTFCPADHEPGQYIDEEMATDEMTDGVDWVFRPANPIQHGVRDKYRRLRLEMQILASKAHEDLGDVHRGRPWLVSHVRAESYMRKLLDADEKLYAMSQNVINFDDNSAEEPCFHKLGVTAAFSDTRILDFFSLQVKYDEPQTSYYLSALEAIAKRRNSLQMLTEFQRQKSMGAYTRSDLREAYAALLANETGPIDLDAEVPYSEEDDETLINIAASMMMDNAPLRNKIRTALEIIGKDRDSQEIRRYLNTPERDFVDVDSALRYLGAESGTDDDFLITLYDLKSEENSALARSALETVADDRRNVRLRRFLDTGDRDVLPSVSFSLPDPTDVEMLDPDLAYSRLGVDDRTTDDDMLIMLYEIRAADDPDEATGLKKALELLGDVRNSKVIKSYLETGSKEVAMYQPPEASAERPVGLENIGNTCYLNSLLQYYFTIEPLRSAILNLDFLIEVDTGAEVLQRKKVGGRHVTGEEIERAVRFIKELRKLFRHLISSTQASMRPSRAVCFLALVSQRDEKDSVRTATLSAPVDSTSHLDKGVGLSLEATNANQLVLHGQVSNSPDADVEGLKIEEQAISPSSHESTSDRAPKRKVSTNQMAAMGDQRSSGDTSIDLMDLDQDPIMSTSSSSIPLPSTRSETQHNPDAASEKEAESKKVKLADSDDDQTNMFQERSTQAETEADENLVDVPALPPRRPERRRQSSVLWSETNDWGRQQDVAECIDNVLFQLEAALRPTGHDDDGEQLDLIKTLFYGLTKQTLAMKDNQPKLERFSNTIVTLEADGQDIYQALDGVFDAREVELGGKDIRLDLTIAKAPPILQIQVQRVGFDLKSMSAIKSNLYLALDQSIYLDRYLDTDSDELLQKREAYWQWKKELIVESERIKELQNLIAAAEVAGPQHSDHIWSATENEVDSSDDDTEYIHIENVNHDGPSRSFEARQASLVHEVTLDSDDPTPTLSKEDLEKELRITQAKERDLSFKTRQVFDEYRAHEYRLHSVFIHRGEASHGHYWVYIYDFVLDKWRKYNDEEVTDVMRDEVFKDRKGSNENPYMLSYVRSDKLNYTAALERDLGKVWEEDSLL